MPKCKSCGGDSSKVLDSRINAADYCTRRRQCDDCSFRWTTFEITADAFDAFMFADRIAQLKDADGQFVEMMIERLRQPLLAI